MHLSPDRPRRSALFVPGSNDRALAKAAALPCDMIIVDLEDSVRDDGKDGARDAAIAALAEGFGRAEAGVRLNLRGTPWHVGDVTAVRASKATFVVLPKVEDAVTVATVARGVERPVLAMIETPAGVLAAPSIAVACAGLIVGTNDLAATLQLPPGSGRGGLGFALQAVVLAARAAGVPVLDGVFNRLDDAEGLAAECAEGRAFGFDGKTLIHPAQIATANAAFGPTPQEVEEARALIAAFGGGAERFRDRMIEAMHVAQARRVLALAGE
ncbi:HpcH/HpaI aldolase/citrate lyase family protein [Sphingomonas quercus]|uniref:CoA ester lyase n=1 Tax=Sphingomonas quercus TaxID=2842451 RepID=A0ABS6BE41_9SPHN|nr:CoA ester lyase [Sphingomonas quercus]MBU3076590.1 CoA ester lyase [Sphingomonas quercus]